MRKIKSNGIIYKYISPSGKCYIGQTWHEYQRKQTHMKNINCSAFNNAIKSYGYDAFSYEVLYKDITCQEIMDCLEIWEIENNNSLAPNGYNLETGGSHGIPSNESRARMSVSQKGKKKPPIPQDVRDKISKAHIGMRPSPETREKLRIAQTGKKATPEARANMSKASLGKKRGPYTKRNKPIS